MLKRSTCHLERQLH